MRVGLIIYGSLETISGGYLYDRCLVNHLKSQGDEVRIYSLSRRRYLANLADNYSKHLRKQLENDSLDILLEDELNHPSLFQLNQALKHSIRYPIITVVHHLRSSEQFPQWQTNFHRWVERKFLKSVDGYIFNSHTTHQDVIKLIFDPSKKPFIIAKPGGDRLKSNIKERDLRERALQEGALNLLFLGNLIPRKGLHTLIKALRSLPKDTWNLRVIGNPDIDKEYTQSIKKNIQINHLEKNIEIYGSLSDPELVRHLETSHVLAMPSFYEGYGIVYIEGMGFGLPAIGTNAGGAREIISEGETGFLITPEDSDSLKKKVVTLHRDRERLLSMSLAARRFYLSHPTWDKTTSNIREFLLSMI